MQLQLTREIHQLDTDRKPLLQKSLLQKSLLQRLDTTLCLWFQRHRTRQALLKLDDRILQDVGLSRADALHEASKWFWQK